MLKILMVAPFPHQGRTIKGGVEAVMHNLSYGFKALEDTSIHLLVFNQATDEIINYSSNIEVHFVKRKFKNKKLDFKFHAMSVLLKENEEWNPDIIHIQGNGSTMLLYNHCIADKLVFTQHGVVSKELEITKSFLRKINYLIALFIEKKYRKAVKNWVFISQYNLNLNKDLIKPDVHYAKIYNPVNPDYFIDFKRIKTRNCYYVARLTHEKGFHVLVQAIGHMQKKDIHVNVIGGWGGVNYKKNIDTLLEKNNDRRKLTFHGWKNGEEIRSIVKDDLIMVLPSFQENLPVVIAEAMAMGKIVVATNICGIPEMITKETGFLFPPGDFHALAKILDLIQELPEEKIEEMSLNARKRALNLYDPIKIAEKHRKFYQEILSLE